jgi:hypothetical protein
LNVIKERVDPMTQAQKGALALKTIAINMLNESIRKIRNADPMKPDDWKDVIDGELSR